jgi:hypothetical protein
MGQEVGMHAGYLLEYLSAELLVVEDPEQPWLEDDLQAFEDWTELENWAEHLTGPVERGQRGSAQNAEFHDLWHKFHTALPYNEAERAWVREAFRDPMVTTPEDMPRQIGYREERILMSGLRQVVSGRDLMRRWIAWRRETDEFKDQGTLDVARGALQGLVELLTPDAPSA